MQPTSSLPELPVTQASPLFVMKRLERETEQRGQGLLRNIIDAGRRILETRGPCQLASEIGRYRRAMAKLGWRPPTLEEINLLYGLIPIVGRSASVADIRPEHIVRLLESRLISRESANNYRNNIAAFLNWWSIDQGVRFNPAILVQMRKLKLRLADPPPAPAGRRGTKRRARHEKNRKRRLTNKQIRKLLLVTLRFRPDALVILLVSLFLALRPEAEAIPIWEDFDEHARTWKIRAATVKTRVCRTVPIPSFLMSWLMLLRQEKGPIVTFGYDAWKNVRLRIFERAGVPFKDDCLRVTGISNWVVFYDNLKWVAKQLGNSAYVVKANYMDPPTPAAAAAFMAIYPPEGWLPRSGYRAGKKNWSAIRVDEVMTTVPTLRQSINFLREPSMPVIAPTVIAEPLRRAA